ncbi:MAG TPA: hypothetical protein VMM12_02030 [Longimicrobiales bacterium]|nr:hypothetical protein [Longimicrobiales bacterium]
MHWNVRPVLAAGLVSLLAAWAAPAQAQDSGHGYRQVLSANPFGLLLKFFNAEYERALTESTTIGIGGSFGTNEDVDEFTGETEESTWFNGDVFWRFYPSGSHFEGWNFGVKAGLTHQEGWSQEPGTNFGLGFDANRSWLLGKNNNFYVGVGFGLKRLFGEVPDGGLEIVPTIRVVNVGFAF